MRAPRGRAALRERSADAPPRSGRGPCPGATLPPTGTDGAAVDVATLCLVNAVRAAYRLHPLRPNRQLAKVATSQVATMIRWDYFADVRPTGQTPMSLVGVTRYPAHTAGFAVGQNIAWGTASFASPEHIVAEWMASPPHRAIILTGCLPRRRRRRDARLPRRPACRPERRDLRDGVRRPPLLGERGAPATCLLRSGAAARVARHAPARGARL